MFFNKSEPVVEITPSTLSLDSAGEKVVKCLIDSSNPEWIDVFEQGKSGVQGAYEKCLEIIETILTEQKITVQEYTYQEAAIEIFKHHYGLKELDDLYKDPEIDEIRIAPNGKAYVIRKGRLERTDIQYTDTEVANLINRLKPISDVGVSLDERHPTMELVRPDGSRLTALCRPVTEGYCFALRKPGHLEAVDLIKLQTLDERVSQVLNLLVKGRRNILICGGVNSGKTTLLRLLAGELDSQLSVRVLDIDNELRLAQMYPDREIWELEAHPEVGADMISLFTKILRITPDVIVVPEFRGFGEVWTTIEACTRGHDGSMATAHFSSFASPEEAIRNTAMLAMKEGAQLPLELVIERVAQAFQIITQTFNDARKGIKKITSITEVVVDNGQIIYNPLVEWEPYGDDYTGAGEWKILNPPSVKCCTDMRVYGVTLPEIRETFGVMPSV
mgnify:CR=1 FL=1